MLHNVYNIYKYVYTHTKECLKPVWRWPCEHFEKTEKTDDLEVIYYQSSWLSCLHPSLDENVTDPFFNFIVDYQIIFFSEYLLSLLTLLLLTWTEVITRITGSFHISKLWWCGWQIATSLSWNIYTYSAFPC